MKHDLTELTKLDIPYNDSTKFGDYTIKIEQDSDCESPREWDNLGTMVCWHRNYILGDKHGYETPRVFMHVLSGLYSEEATEFLTAEQHDRCEVVAHEKNIILPLFLYDHSGITMNTTGFSCGWDSGQVGVIYISKEQVRKEYNWKLISQKRHKQIEQYLTGEVETYDQYLTGDVFGYSVEREDPDGDEEHVDSCWGFFGYDDEGMLAEIKSAIMYDIKSIPQQLPLV